MKLPYCPRCGNPKKGKFMPSLLHKSYSGGSFGYVNKVHSKKTKTTLHNECNFCVRAHYSRRIRNSTDIRDVPTDMRRFDNVSQLRQFQKGPIVKM